MAFYVIRLGGNRKASGRADLRTEGLPTAGSAITGALAGGSCSASKKDMAQESLQVSSSLNPVFAGFLYRETALSSFTYLYSGKMVSTHFVQT